MFPPIFFVHFIQAKLQMKKDQSDLFLSTHLTINFSALIVKEGHQSHRTALLCSLLLKKSGSLQC